jgi:hypothetical protein
MAYGSRNNRKKILDSIVEGADGGSIMEGIEYAIQSEDNRSRGRGAASAAKSLEDTYQNVSSMKRSLGEKPVYARSSVESGRAQSKSTSSVAKDWMTILTGQAQSDKPDNDIKFSQQFAERMANPQTADDKYLVTGVPPTVQAKRSDINSALEEAILTQSPYSITTDAERAEDAQSGSGVRIEDRFPDDEDEITSNFPARPTGLMTRTGLSDDDMGLPNYERSAFMAPNSLFRTALKEKEAGSYSTLFGDSEKNNTPFKGVDITTMPMSEVLDLVKYDGDFHKYNKARKKPQNTTAIGKYQFVGATLRDLKKRGVFKKLGITDDTLFDESTQDALSEYQAIHRIRDRGDGTMSGARKEMRNEWEGFKKISDSRLDSIINEISSEIGVIIGGTKLAPRESLRPKSRPSL